MFAFALWDREARALTLGRDRLGIKPLCYGVLPGGGLIFGSTLHAVRAHPEFDAEIDSAALAAYFRFAYVPGTSTIHAAARKVAPGTLLTFRRPASAPEADRFWSPEEVATGPRMQANEREATERVDAALRLAVRQRLLADVPVGAFLSGGIDSSLVAALMQEASPQRVRTYSIGSRDAEYDESRHAAAVAAFLGTEHTELIVDGSEALAVVPELPLVHDEPFADSSQLPTLLVSRLARREVTVALSGDGGDELFGGYNRHVYAPALWRTMSVVPPMARSLVARLASSDAAQRVSGAALGRAFRSPAVKLRKLAAILPAESPEALYLSLQSQWQAPCSLVLGAGAETRPEDAGGHQLALPERMMLADLCGYLPGDILTKVDRASMAVSLEVRVPILDHRVVELAWRLPLETKLRNAVGKRVLRSVLARRVPRHLWERPKAGFSVPVGAWMRAELRPWVESLLDPVRLRREGVLHAPTVTRAWNEHISGVDGWEQRLWAVVMFQAWYESWRR